MRWIAQWNVSFTKSCSETTWEVASRCDLCYIKPISSDSRSWRVETSHIHAMNLSDLRPLLEDHPFTVWAQRHSSSWPRYLPSPNVISQKWIGQRPIRQSSVVRTHWSISSPTRNFPPDRPFRHSGGLLDYDLLTPFAPTGQAIEKVTFRDFCRSLCSMIARNRSPKWLLTASKNLGRSKAMSRVDCLDLTIVTSADCQMECYKWGWKWRLANGSLVHSSERALSAVEFVETPGSFQLISLWHNSLIAFWLILCPMDSIRTLNVFSDCFLKKLHWLE